MSNHTKAWALVREVPEHELRDALIAAHERIFDATEELNDGTDEPGDLDASVYNALAWRDEIQDAADKAECSTSEVADWIENAREQLEATPKADVDLSASLKEANERIEALEAERALLKAEVRQLEAAAHIPEDVKHAVGDVLAMSRKLTSFCEAAGIKPATLRVTRSRKRAS